VEDFQVTRAGSVVAPRGEIDLATTDAVRVEIDAAAAEAKLVVLDLRETTFIDSSGIRLIVEAAIDIEGRDGELVVVRGGAEVTRVFDLVGLEGRVRLLDVPPGE
jgi:anti-sigma B factor antagonist